MSTNDLNKPNKINQKIIHLIVEFDKRKHTFIMIFHSQMNANQSVNGSLHDRICVWWTEMCLIKAWNWSRNQIPHILDVNLFQIWRTLIVSQCQCQPSQSEGQRWTKCVCHLLLRTREKKFFYKSSKGKQEEKVTRQNWNKFKCVELNGQRIGRCPIEDRPCVRGQHAGGCIQIEGRKREGNEGEEVNW